MASTAAVQDVRHADGDVQIIRPDRSAGAEMWRVARDSETLDVNSSYMYLMFARDFADTCRVALVDDRVAGFVLGYRRPHEPECLFVWQVAVDHSQRGRGLAARLIDDVVADAETGARPFRFLETTITDDNTASRRTFERFAHRWGATISTEVLLEAAHFPDDHEAERLHRIGPLQRGADA